MIYDAAIKEVVKFNEVGGNTRGYPKSPDWGILSLQISLINDELEELIADEFSGDLENSVKEAADIIVTAIGYIHRAGYDPSLVMSTVNKSNMSKFTNDSGVLNATAARFNGLGVEVAITSDQGLFCIKSASDQTGTDGKEYPKGKILKMNSYHEANLEGTERV